jgi:hypothetical protein
VAAGAVLRRVGQSMRERGPVPVARDCLGWGIGYLAGLPRVGRGGGSFVVDGERVPYFRHPYHYTWLNERAVEVALARRVLAGRPEARVLEIGNVLSHYLPVHHPVVDKYERAPGVRNVDVADLDPDAEADLVVSVSTLEHVGLDEQVRDPGKPVRAIHRLVDLLAPGGMLWVTLPVGYNPDLDRQLRAGAVAFDRLSALRRAPHRNRWRQVPVEQVWDAPYDRLLYTAHGLLVGEISRLP